MKKLLSVMSITLLVSILFLVGCGEKKTGDNSLGEIKEKGKFIVGLDDTFAPMGFRDEKGEIAGLDIDLAKEVGKRMGVDVVFQPVEWDGILLSLNNKDIDVIWNGLSITEERKKQIDFSKPYIKSKQVIVTINESEIKSKKDLSGKVVAIQMGSTSEDAIKSEPEVLKTFKDVKKYSNYAEALMDLKAGRVDAVVIDEIVGRYYTNKKKGEYKVVDNEDFGEQAMGVGIRKSDKSFKEELQKILDEMKKDGTTKKISEKWFGKDIIIK